MERSKKVIFVSHLLLNQNVMPCGCERAPGAIKELLDLLGESGVGIIQLPDPEVECFGLERKPKGKDVLDTKNYRAICKKHVSEILRQIEMYTNSSYKVIGILGVEFNPTWAVHQLANGTRSVPGKGILIEELETAMRAKRYQIPIVGINLNNIFSSAEKLQALLNST